MRKEYNDRQSAPLVNPGFTLPEYEAARQKQKPDSDFQLRADFERMVINSIDEVSQAAHFAKVAERSEAAARAAK